MHNVFTGTISLNFLLLQESYLLAFLYRVLEKHAQGLPAKKWQRWALDLCSSPNLVLSTTTQSDFTYAQGFLSKKALELTLNSTHVYH